MSSSEQESAEFAAAAAPPLRVGLLLSSYMQPAWVRRILTEIASSKVAEIVLVVEDASVGKQTTFFQNLASKWKNRHLFLYKLYSRVDARLFRCKPDAFALENVADLLAGVPCEKVEPIQTKFSDKFPDEALGRVSGHHLDVALRFGFRILRGRILSLPRYGVWSYHHGDNLKYRGGPPGFWEMMERDPTTGAVLQVLSESLDNGQVLCRSITHTGWRSLTRNINQQYWQATSMVADKLKELYHRGPVALSPAGKPDVSLYGGPLYKLPRNGTMVRFVARLAMRYVRDKIEATLRFPQWMIAYQITGSNEGAPPLYQFKKLIPPADRFWGDPFPLKWEGKYYIFFEELMYSAPKGYLCVMEVNREGIVGSPRKILERPCHLSYPFVFRIDEGLYMIPETGRAETVELYRCVAFPDQWEFDRVLLAGVRAVDNTIVEIDGTWWMFSSIEVAAAPKVYELHLFYASHPFGPWRPHLCNPVSRDAFRSRPAGRAFQKDGIWYRPTQEGFGRAVLLQRIDCITPDQFEETEVGRIGSEWLKNLIGTHTLNRFEDIVVVDGLLSRSRYGNRKGALPSASASEVKKAVEPPRTEAGLPAKP